MEDLTIGQIVAVISTITIIGGFFIAIFKWFKKTFSDRFDYLEKRVEKIEKKDELQDKEIKDSKVERLVMINGLLACLKGLHNDLNCNGPVTQGIKDIESYLINKSHE